MYFSSVIRLTLTSKNAVARLFHAYRKSWKNSSVTYLLLPSEENQFHCFVIKTCYSDGNIVEHVPMEVSTRF